MPTTIQADQTEGAIWSRLLAAAGNRLSEGTARSILSLDFPQEDKEQMHVLAAKARAGTLNRADKERIKNYERVGNLLALMKSKARQRLRKAAPANGNGRS